MTEKKELKIHCTRAQRFPYAMEFVKQMHNYECDVMITGFDDETVLVETIGKDGDVCNMEYLVTFGRDSSFLEIVATTRSPV